MKEPDLKEKFFPSCTKETWILRQKLLEKVRNFFSKRHVLEVETPALSQACGTDVHLDYFYTLNPEKYLITSPEFHLKRLLAAGFGDIYAIAKSFRIDESGNKHNSEFTMVEWYRLGFSMETLMKEVEALCSFILGKSIQAERLTFKDAFLKYAGISPFEEDENRWIACCEKHNVPVFPYDTFSLETFRNFVLAFIIEPEFNKESGVFLYDYPETEAALAQLEKKEDGRFYAKRFELYLGGMELCNGYQELTNAKEQANRFQADLEMRKLLHKHLPKEDKRFLAALEYGMPACSGVALGLDRLFMLALNKTKISDVILFPDEIS